MSLIDHFALLARYNAWMNAKIIDAARQLPMSTLLEDRGAFFGSIFGTLNHLIVADTVWLKRFMQHPAQFAALASLADLPQPNGLDDLPCANLDSYVTRRAVLDDALSGMVAALQPTDLEAILDYRNFKGVAMRKAFAPLLLHVFNHQTHHRGQASTLFFQAGIDIGVTDLPMLIPDAV